MLNGQKEKVNFFPQFPKDHDYEGVTEKIGEIYLGGKKQFLLICSSFCKI